MQLDTEALDDVVMAAKDPHVSPSNSDTRADEHWAGKGCGGNEGLLKFSKHPLQTRCLSMRPVLQRAQNIIPQLLCNITQ